MFNKRNFVLTLALFLVVSDVVVCKLISNLKNQIKYFCFIFFFYTKT